MSALPPATAMPDATGQVAGAAGGGDVAATDASTTAGASAAPVADAAQGVADLQQAIAGLQTAVANLATAVQALQQSMAVGGGGPATTCGCASMSEPTTSQVLAPAPGTQEYSTDGGGADAAPGDAPAGNHAAHAAAEPSSPSVDVKRWVTGDTDGLHRDLLEKLAQVGEKIGRKVDIVSGFRTRAEQQHLYDLYKAGKGNLAAKPGHSNHESGNAADVNVGGKSLADDPEAKKAALALGLHFPVGGEPWHVEVK